MIRVKFNPKTFEVAYEVPKDTNNYFTTGRVNVNSDNDWQLGVQYISKDIKKHGVRNSGLNLIYFPNKKLYQLISKFDFYDKKGELNKAGSPYHWMGGTCVCQDANGMYIVNIKTNTIVRKLGVDESKLRQLVFFDKYILIDKESNFGSRNGEKDHFLCLYANDGVELDLDIDAVDLKPKYNNGKFAGIEYKIDGEDFEISKKELKHKYIEAYCQAKKYHKLHTDYDRQR